jgi:hypothetical protein
MQFTEDKPEDYLLPKTWQSLAIPILGVGVGLVLLSSFLFMLVGGKTGKLFCHSYLTNFMYVLSFTIGAMFLVLVSFLTRAGWSATVRRMPEILSSTIPWMALLFIPIAITLFVGGGDAIYEWNGAEVHGLTVLKLGFLNKKFFLFRAAIYFIVWSLIVLAYYRMSLKQDETKDIESTLTRQKWSGPCIMLFALSVSFAAWDWLMSIDSDWYSTIFGVYYFAQSMFGMFAFTILTYLMLQKAGKVKKTVTIENFHDLAKFQFGFVMFWSYIAFSQLLLIWYANIPEETAWFRDRWENGWMNYSYTLIAVHFAIPLLGLMSRHVRRNRFGLAFWTTWALIVHWIDMTFLVMPNTGELSFSMMLAHLVCGLGMFSIFIGVLLLRATNIPLTTKGDPRIHEALTYANPIL